MLFHPLGEDNMKENKIARDELIGLKVTIKECTDPKLEDVTGTILDETKNMFLINVDKKHIKIAKKIAKFQFEVDGKKIMIDGSKILYRPEDRIKKIR